MATAFDTSLLSPVAQLISGKDQLTNTKPKSQFISSMKSLIIVYVPVILK
ncbi:hypothetical protein Echvi_0833 [Echinicola vietnamensis DSM 17526]|uniref:Uncharacterized protein n=1 Tax=Echinicola vietnamensis (strain DSM 17526 / LMG 23754 / KMM 6221) TaxID=926556 RepID=L0FWI1_ECHVK|nr:hypothetical protein Echvi_0833 [Echinicola vietnamensis DSM 17526]